MEYVLGKYVKIARYGKGGIIGGGSKEQIIEDLKLWEQLVAVAHIFTNPRDYNQAQGESIRLMPEAVFKKHFTLLLEKNFIIPHEFTDFHDGNRYSRNFFHYQSYGANPNGVQENLKKSRVVIVGCGGIGNHVAVVLATAGIGEIILLDNDIIEKTNLTRQVLFTEDDIGLKKTAVVKRELQRRNSEISISEISLNIDTPEDLDKVPAADMWLVSADHPFNLILWVNRYCVLNNQTYINAGYVNDIAVFGPLYIPGRTGCYECQNVVASMYGSEMNDTDLLVKDINQRYKTPTFAPVNNIAAAMCANDIIKFLGKYDTPLSLNKRIGIWSDNIQIKIQNMERSALCNICGIRM